MKEFNVRVWLDSDKKAQQIITNIFAETEEKAEKLVKDDLRIDITEYED